MKKAKISPEQEAMDVFEKEFDKATEQGNHRIVFVKRCSERNPKEAKFIKRVEEQLVRKGFNDFEELRTSVYSSLIRFLEDNEYLRFLPWDASLHRTATLDDIDREKVKSFVFPTTVKTKPLLSYQTFRGSIFELVDEAVGFVMQHIDAAVSVHNKAAVVPCRIYREAWDRNHRCRRDLRSSRPSRT